MIFPRFTLGRVAAGIAKIFNDLIESIRNNVEVFRVRNRNAALATYPKGTIVTLFNDGLGAGTPNAITATDNTATTYAGVLEEPLVYNQVGICRHANVVFVRMVNGLAPAVDDGVWETVTLGCTVGNHWRLHQPPRLLRWRLSEDHHDFPIQENARGGQGDAAVRWFEECHPHPARNEPDVELHRCHHPVDSHRQDQRRWQQAY
jgi:hypothetical protein